MMKKFARRTFRMSHVTSKWCVNSSFSFIRKRRARANISTCVSVIADDSLSQAESGVTGLCSTNKSKISFQIEFMCAVALSFSSKETRKSEYQSLCECDRWRFCLKLKAMLQILIRRIIRISRVKSNSCVLLFSFFHSKEARKIE